MRMQVASEIRTFVGVDEILTDASHLPNMTNRFTSQRIIDFNILLSQYVTDMIPNVVWIRLFREFLEFKGAGGGGVHDPGKVKIEFYVVPGKGECQLPDAFYQI